MQPLFALNIEAKKDHKRIKMAANWRCVEFEALLPQLAYLLKEHTDIANVLIAYCDLYKSLRAVAPLLGSVKKAMRECALQKRTVYLEKYAKLITITVKTVLNACLNQTYSNWSLTVS